MILSYNVISCPHLDILNNGANALEEAHCDFLPFLFIFPPGVDPASLKVFPSIHTLYCPGGKVSFDWLTLCEFFLASCLSGLSSPSHWHWLITTVISSSPSRNIEKVPLGSTLKGNHIIIQHILHYCIRVWTSITWTWKDQPLRPEMSSESTPIAFGSKPNKSTKPMKATAKPSSVQGATESEEAGGASCKQQGVSAEDKEEHGTLKRLNRWFKRQRLRYRYG